MIAVTDAAFGLQYQARLPQAQDLYPTPRHEARYPATSRLQPLALYA
ncbi:hypothetical protein [Tritonibacter multivorans]|nr:hypothetical protein [Tritonibacter multivorans]